MRPETLSILCDPFTHESLEQAVAPAGEDRLVVRASGRSYPLIDGIPAFEEPSRVSGLNRRYLRFYDRVAPLYDLALAVYGFLVHSGEERFRREYLREMEVAPGSRVLEVSVGTGANLRYLPPQAEVFGLDLSWGMLRQCRRNLRRWQREAELIQGNAERLPFVDGAFDSVLHMGGINAFDDRAQAIREMIRVARPGAKIVIADETAQSLVRLAYLPGVRDFLNEFQDRLLAPVALVPQYMNEIEVKPIVGGRFYCLTFRKPPVSTKGAEEHEYAETERVAVT